MRGIDVDTGWGCRVGYYRALGDSMCRGISIVRQTGPMPRWVAYGISLCAAAGGTRASETLRFPENRTSRQSQARVLGFCRVFLTDFKTKVVGDISRLFLGVGGGPQRRFKGVPESDGQRSERSV